MVNITTALERYEESDSFEKEEVQVIEELITILEIYKQMLP